jgi:hypothetical protein
MCFKLRFTKAYTDLSKICSTLRLKKIHYTRYVVRLTLKHALRR